MQSRVQPQVRQTLQGNTQQPNSNPSIPNPNNIISNPMGWLGYVLGSSAVTHQPIADTLGTTIKNSPINQALEGAANVSVGLNDIVVKLQDGTFWLNVGGLLVGGIFVIISANGLIKQELLSGIKSAL